MSLLRFTYLYSIEIGGWIVPEISQSLTTHPTLQQMRFVSTMYLVTSFIKLSEKMLIDLDHKVRYSGFECHLCLTSPDLSTADFTNTDDYIYKLERCNNLAYNETLLHGVT